MTDNADDIAAIHGVTRLGDLVVDDETGEILEWPDLRATGLDRLEWLGRQRADARQEENAWKSVGGFYGKLIGQLMEADELVRYNGDTISITSSGTGDRRYGDPALLRALEVGPRRETRAILFAATRLDLAILRDLESRRLLPRGTGSEISRGSPPATYYQVRRARHAAPRLEQGLRETGE